MVEIPGSFINGDIVAISLEFILHFANDPRSSTSSK